MNPTAPERRAVIYVRISVDRDEQTSTDSQERIAREYAAARGWTVVAVEVDRGRSAYKIDGRRPALDKVFQLIESGAADTLIVWKLDRFTRSIANFGKMWHRLGEAGGQFVSVTDAFDTTTAMGKAMLQIAVVFAELESGIKSERIGAWHEERTLVGASPTGPRPFGYTRAEVGGLAVEPAEAREIRAAAKKVLNGGSLTSITGDLNARGIPTASTRGSTWTNRTLRYVLTNPTTAGLRETAGLLAVGSWEPVLDRETWDRVRTILLDPARRLSMSNTRRWLLSGHLTCGRCGGALRPRTHLKGHRYTCTGTCALSAPAEPLDEYIGQAIVELIDRDAWNRLRAAGKAPGIDVGALEAELAELAALYAEGGLTLGEWRTMRAGITDRVARAADQPVALPDVDDLASSWHAFTVDAKQLVLAAIVESITITPGKIGSQAFDLNRVHVTWRV
jgi:site-specific DNA recombinase